MLPLCVALSIHIENLCGDGDLGLEHSERDISMFDLIYVALGSGSSPGRGLRPLLRTTVRP